MPYKDLRQFLAKLDKEKELLKIKEEVDWNLELGAIERRSIEIKGPALHFQKIKDYPKEYTVVGNQLCATKPVPHGRISLALDLPKTTPTLDLIEEFTKRSRERIKPVIVKDGPCKENIQKGKDVNILKFPAPFIHGTDGGRYIGTWHTNIIKDPDSDWVNWGMYRLFILDEKTTCYRPGAVQHGGLFHKTYKETGKPMPMAVAIGTEPVTTIVTASHFPANVNEVDVTGGLRGEPVELVKCETLDLYVPAHSEIVLEGYVAPDEIRLEGPHGEYLGYESSGKTPTPVFHIQCVTHRNNPIFTTNCTGKPWDDYHTMNSITLTSILTEELRSRAIAFKSLYVPPPIIAVIVSVKAPYPAYAHTLASAIWSTKGGAGRPFIFIVDEDIDVTNIEEVFWCLTTRLHPQRSIHISHRMTASALQPYLSRKEKDELVGAGVYFDATFPTEWPKEETATIIDFEHAWPKEIKDKVLKRWKKYGFSS